MTDRFTLERPLLNWITGRRRYANRGDEVRSLTPYFDVTSTRQWSSQFGEYLVQYLLEVIWGVGRVTRQPRIDGHLLDLETPDAIYEVKTRNYSTHGTIGDKILGAPYKYANMDKGDKPLYIILVGYQEREGERKYNIFNPTGLQAILIDLYAQRKIHYMRCSDLLFKVQYTLVLRELENN